MELIREGDIIKRSYIIQRADGTAEMIGLFNGKHIANRNYILHENILYPFEIETKTRLKFI